ncbi:carbohydrate binding domain-containing protein [Candidatus Poribacteria bacterium]
MRILKNTNLMIVGMVVLVAWLLSSSLSFADEEIENLVKGGDFEEDIDMSHWAAFSSGAATITMEKDKKESAVGEASLFIDVTGIDPAKTWNPQFRQLPYGTAMSVEKGETYTLSMFLKAEEQRNIQLLVFQEVPSYVVRLTKTVTVGTEWEEYWVTSMIPESSLVAMKLLNAGAGKGRYWMDGVRFYEGEYVPTEIGGPQIAVDSRSKFTTTWGSIKAQN